MAQRVPAKIQICFFPKTNRSPLASLRGDSSLGHMLILRTAVQFEFVLRTSSYMFSWGCIVYDAVEDEVEGGTTVMVESLATCNRLEPGKLL